MSAPNLRACFAAIAVIAAPIAVFGIRGAAAAMKHASSPVGAAVSSQVGPRARPSAMPDAVVAHTFEELAALVRDAHGPRDIELVPHVYQGDLAIHRAVAIRGAEGTVLEGTGGSTVVTIDANDVTLENLAIRRSGRRHTAEDSGVKATGQRARVADVTIRDTLFGISLQACTACVVERAHVVGLGEDAELRGDGIKLW